MTNPIAVRVARRFLEGLHSEGYEHPNGKALKDYLKEHPGADPSKHWVQHSEKLKKSEPSKAIQPEGAKDEPSKDHSKKIEVNRSHPSVLYHGSMEKLPVGETLKAKPSYNVAFGGEVGKTGLDAEKITEALRPEGAPSRYQAIYLGGNPKTISGLGGQTNHIYKMTPGKDTIKADSAWVYAIKEVLGDLQYRQKKDPKAKLTDEEQKKVEEYATSYWEGQRHPNTASDDYMEYLTTEVKVDSAHR